MSSITPAVVQHAPRTRLRRALSWGLIAGSVILVGLCIGRVVALWRPDDPSGRWVGLSLFLLLLSFPILYVLGFRRYLPESIGGVAGPARGDEARRWRSFMRVALALVLLPQAGLALSVAIDSDILLEKFTSLLVMPLAALFFTLLGKAVGAAGATSTDGEVVAPRRSPLGRLAALLSPGVSLRSASLLVLVTLITATSANWGCSTHLYRGHEIVRGKADWITVAALLTSPAGRWTRLLAETERALYVLALALAIFTMAATVRRRVSFRTLPLRWLRGVSGAIALWALSDVIGILWANTRAVPYLYVPWLLVWLVPPMLWARHVTSDSPHALERWRHLRAFLVIAWLPLVGVAYTFVWAFCETYGYVIFFFAVQLLWWGYLTAPTTPDSPVSAEAAS